MTIVVGLTGGIGSGKSAVTHYLQMKDIPTVDTDLIARQVVEPGSTGLNKIIDYFGKDFLTLDNRLNRALLREKVFNNIEDKNALEAILHPLIQSETIKIIANEKTASPSHIIVAIPLLIEGIIKNNKPDYIDEIWVVDCAEKQQIARATSRDNNSVEQIQKIINLQATREQRLAYADQVIDNNGSLEQLYSQIDELIIRKV